jgi:geranylgeranyl pyrophosphate synthase
VTVDELLRLEREQVEAALHRLLPAADRWPDRLHRAMEYAVTGGGKRIRPILARLVHAAVGGDPGDITEAACGLELIHTYSLIHDDLPAMDDDELRRGRPTVHVAFDEATAILAGDALLTEGLLVLASYPRGDRWAARRDAAISMVAEAVSSRGMVGGQMADLEATGRVGDGAVATEDELERIHCAKTGALIRASAELGAVLAGIDDRSAVVRYGERLGLAFQVADDVLDATGGVGELGKTPGKDAAASKLTFVTLHGLDEARRTLGHLEDELVELAAAIEGPAGSLAEIARYVINRTS